jgi:rhomboid protease GluP
MVRATMQRGVWLTLIINLVITFSIPFISRSGHVGGLLTGIGLALFIPYSPPNERKTPTVWRVWQIVLMAVVALCFGLMFWNYRGDPPSLARFLAGANVSPENKTISRFAEACNEGERVYRRIVQHLETGQPVPPETLAASAAARQRLKQLRPFNAGATRLADELHDLLEEQARMLTEPISPQAVEQMRERLAIYEQHQQQWIAEEGAQYGLEFVPSAEAAARPDGSPGRE